MRVEFTDVNFGIYKGKEKILPQILFTDPNWFFDTYEKDGFKKGSPFLRQAEFINTRARNIAIPKDNRLEWEVRYILDKDMHFESLIIAEKESLYCNKLNKIVKPDRVIISDKIDMNYLRTLEGYNKKQYIAFLRDLKEYIFNNQKRNISGEFCEIYFFNDRNFLLGIPPRKGFL